MFFVFLRLSKTAPGIQIGFQKCDFIVYFRGLFATLGHSMLRDSLMELCWDTFLLFYFLGAFLACLGSFLGLLRSIWESLGPLLGASWASLRDLGVSLRPYWALLGLSWVALERLLAYLGPLLLYSLGLLLGFPFRPSWPLNVYIVAWDVLQKRSRRTQERQK